MIQAYQGKAGMTLMQNQGGANILRNWRGGHEGKVWIGGGMAQDHVTAIASRNAIRVFTWEDFLYVLILLRHYYNQMVVSFISIRIYSSFSLANRQPVVERFLHRGGLVAPIWIKTGPDKEDFIDGVEEWMGILYKHLA